MILFDFATAEDHYARKGLPMIRWILFDFGGVLAEEGFREGLKAIAANNGLDGESFLPLAYELVYETGYVRGLAEEHVYWQALRDATGIETDDRALRETIISCFILRPLMLDHARSLRSRGFLVGILSDQTDWLDEIESKNHFFRFFDRVFNSFYIKESKRDASLFQWIEEELQVKGREIVLVDDNPSNVRLAADQGWNSMLFVDPGDFSQGMDALLHREERKG